MSRIAVRALCINAFLSQTGAAARVAAAFL